MISRCIVDTVTAVSGSTFSTPVQVVLKQQQRRLEGFIIECDMPDSVTLSAPTQESFANVIKGIQFQVNDVVGSRDLVNCPGVALLDEWLGLGGGMPICNWTAYGNQLTSAQTNRRICYPVFLRHPQIEEPSGNLFSVPLYELRDNPVLTLTPGTTTEVGTGFAFGTNTRIRVHWLYRDTNVGEYIPTEIRSANIDTISASSTVDLEIPSNGLLTSVLLQGYTTSAKTTRRDLCSAADHDISLWYGREQIRKASQRFLGDWQGWTQSPLGFVVAATTSPGLADVGSKVFFDLSDDMPLIGAYNLNSALNLSSIRSNGDTARITVNQTNASALCVRMTTRKALGGPLGKVQGA